MDIPNPNEIKDAEDALDQSIALNRITMALLTEQKQSNKRMFIALVLSLIFNVLIVAGFLFYNSLYDYTNEVEKETTSIVQEVDNGSNIVNGNQYNDSSAHYESGVSE